jgi:hypothetical protein
MGAQGASPPKNGGVGPGRGRGAAVCADEFCATADQLQINTTLIDCSQHREQFPGEDPAGPARGA